MAKPERVNNQTDETFVATLFRACQQLETNGKARGLVRLDSDGRPTLERINKKRLFSFLKQKMSDIGMSERSFVRNLPTRNFKPNIMLDFARLLEEPELMPGGDELSRVGEDGLLSVAANQGLGGLLLIANDEMQALRNLVKAVQEAYRDGRLFVSEVQVPEKGVFVVDSEQHSAVMRWAADRLVGEVNSRMNTTTPVRMVIGLGATARKVFELFAQLLEKRYAEDEVLQKLRKLEFLPLAFSVDHVLSTDNIPSLFIPQAFTSPNLRSVVAQRVQAAHRGTPRDGAWMLENVSISLTSIASYADRHCALRQHMGDERADSIQKKPVGVVQCWPFDSDGFMPTEEFGDLPESLCTADAFLKFCHDDSKFALMVVTRCPHSDDGTHQCKHDKGDALAPLLIKESKVRAFNCLVVQKSTYDAAAKNMRDA